MADAYTPSGFIKPDVGADDDIWGALLNLTIDLIDDAMCGIEVIALSNVDVTLTAVDGGDDTSRPHFLRLTGSLSGNVVITIPAGVDYKTYVVRNQTTGAFTVTFKTGAGSATALIPQDGNLYWVHRYGSDQVGTVRVIYGALTNEAQSWSAAQTSVPVPLTDAATIAVNAALSNSFEVTLGGNRTLGNPTNLVNGQIFDVLVVQNGVGGFTLAYGSKYRAPAGAFPIVTATAGRASLLTFRYYSSSDRILLISAVLNFNFT